MPSGLDALWLVLREQAAPRHPDSMWRSLLGDAYPAVSGLLQTVRGRAGHWHCGVQDGLGCARRVIEHAPDDLVAVCGDEPPRCDRVVVERAQLALRALDLLAVAGVIAATSGLPSAPVRTDGRGALIGPVQLGPHALLVGLTRHVRSHRLMAMAQELRDRHPHGPLLLLAPLDAPLDAVTARTLRLLDTDVVPLGEVVHPEDRHLAADLSPWLLAHRAKLPGLDPLPLLSRRHRLVLDSARKRVGWTGRWHSLERKLFAHRLLLALAHSAGAVVTRDALFDEVWPADSPAHKQGWENTLRSHKAHLDRVFGKGVIESVRGDTFTGGYALRLDPTDIAWWSEPSD
jgi:hypothetical protein